MAKKIIIVTLLFYALWFLGAELNFFPFIGNSLEVKEIGYCSWLILLFDLAIKEYDRNSMSEKKEKRNNNEEN